MKVPTWFGSVFAILFLAAALQAQSRETLLKYIDESPDWSPAGNAKQYDDKTIDALAAKSAPTIKRYGLNGVSIQDWSGAAGKVRLTMYEMVDTSAAYGLFTFERNPDQPGFSTLPLGTEAFRDGNRTTFWQGKYVVRLDGDAKASEGLGRLVSQNIFGRSRKPDVSELLPPQNLVPNSEKYVIDAAGIGALQRQRKGRQPCPAPVSHSARRPEIRGRLGHQPARRKAVPQTRRPAGRDGAGIKGCGPGEGVARSDRPRISGDLE
jgi:hypothetical protein